jgi:hypothetical protein
LIAEKPHSGKLHRQDLTLEKSASEPFSVSTQESFSAEIEPGKS